MEKTPCGVTSAFAGRSPRGQTGVETGWDLRRNRFDMSGRRTTTQLQSLELMMFNVRPMFGTFSESFVVRCGACSWPSFPDVYFLLASSLQGASAPLALVCRFSLFFRGRTRKPQMHCHRGDSARQQHCHWFGDIVLPQHIAPDQVISCHIILPHYISSHLMLYQIIA